MPILSDKFISLSYLLIFSLHPFSDLPTGLFKSDSLTTTFYAFISFLIYATFPPYLTLVNLILVAMLFGRITNHEVPQCAPFSSLLLFFPLVLGSLLSSLYPVNECSFNSERPSCTPRHNRGMSTDLYFFRHDFNTDCVSTSLRSTSAAH